MKKYISILIIAILLLTLPVIFTSLRSPQSKLIFNKPLYDDDILTVYKQKDQYLIINKSRANEQLTVPSGSNSSTGEVTAIKNKSATELPLHGVSISNGIKITSGRKVHLAGTIPELTLLVTYPEPETTGDRIIIEKNTNTLYFFINGELYKSYKVATGKEPHFTPEGSFTVKNKLNDKDLNEALGLRWMGLSVPCEDDNRSKTDHRAPEGLKYGIHGTDEPASIGNHASGGCIRMSNQDISELHPLLKLGTRVDIVEESN